ncbi:hypothetical protein C5C86_13565 [Rathayibacter sp. AY1E4]|jgi:hypothetical protein|uniref:hypothetical protein n=1 Tax=unclassified Rathayibacter TaxID=2609250 RepID=UPI000CE7837B|nr:MULTISPECIES: hypothetical protein [unclassified Rathayibacter]PPF09988.1 hypothetical protein C5B98_14025 [Rathayibacter sp. AY1A5]PPF33082.1 hypothetical protein C5B93_14330 [Rathayibacter sp. AY1A2]PPG37116.1 hypothetical protein C5C30_13960 [Rathayibacter sp. AY2B5]PPH08217.1 hypothetical protein C5C71_13135 [Rathayibacter sp. AY1C1]PPH14428.1 hypothetical protein C5C35_14540 [Rathayibacter sp. AY1F8]
MSTLIQVDGRKRVSLGKLAQHGQYLVTEEPGGRLVLEPAVVLTVAEQNFLNDPRLVAALQETADTSTATDGRPARRHNASRAA